MSDESRIVPQEQLSSDGLHPLPMPVINLGHLIDIEPASAVVVVIRLNGSSAEDMSRTRINIVESNEEYMMEEPIEDHNFGEKDLESFDVHERTTNGEEGFTDCDDADADENEDGNFRSNGYNWDRTFGQWTQLKQKITLLSKGKQILLHIRMLFRLKKLCFRMFVHSREKKQTKKTTKGATTSSKSAESGSLSWLGASELPIKKING
ncbi:hypothetical protein ZWY2020_009318 [Hordeum vulgare]|nr:hypothetical protein ZWY2020_009318 [Hordeum vulgare]